MLYYDSKTSYRYFKKFREFGLEPKNFGGGSGYQYMFRSALLTVVTDAWNLIDADSRTLSMHGFVTQWKKYAKQYPDLRLFNGITLINLKDSHFEEIRKLRNSLINHMKQNYLDMLKESEFKLDYDMINQVHAEIHGNINAIMSCLFEGQLEAYIEDFYDIQFEKDIGGLIDQRKGTY